MADIWLFNHEWYTIYITFFSYPWAFLTCLFFGSYPYNTPYEKCLYNIGALEVDWIAGGKTGLVAHKCDFNEIIDWDTNFCVACPPYTIADKWFEYCDNAYCAKDEILLPSGKCETCKAGYIPNKEQRKCFSVSCTPS